MPKTFNNLYEKIYTKQNLILAFEKVSKGKSHKKYVIVFKKNLENELAKLHEELKSENFHPQPLHRFVIRDPKTRVIHAPAFRDRVAHHAVCNIIEPIFNNTFIFDSYASRKGKGMHTALIRFDGFKRKLTHNGKLAPYAADNNMTIGWAFKADIRHYFPSINHEILLELLERKVSDKKVLHLLQMIIEKYSPNSDKGIPLGALTSQLFANIYLNPLDHLVKEKLRVKFYIRYMDDFVVLGETKSELEKIKSEIRNFLAHELKLELHSEKSRILPLHRGVGLLGFRIFYYYRFLKKSNLREFYRRFDEMEEEYYTETMEEDEFRNKINGWLAHAEWGNTYRIRKEVEKRLEEILKM